MDSSKDSDAVHFFSVPGAAYLPGEDIFARYQIREAYKVHAHDWVGLFRDGWTSNYTFEYVPVEKEDGQRHSRVTKFISSRLPHEDGNFYQFCYVSSHGEVCGSSSLFQFSKSAQRGAHDDVEDAQVMELEKKIAAELTRKTAADSFVQVQSECQVVKVERDQASAELDQASAELVEQLQQEIADKLKEIAELRDELSSKDHQLMTAQENTRGVMVKVLFADDAVRRENEDLKVHFNAHQNIICQLMDKVAELELELEMVKRQEGSKGNMIQRLLRSKKEKQKYLRKDHNIQGEEMLFKQQSSRPATLKETL